MMWFRGAGGVRTTRARSRWSSTCISRSAAAAQTSPLPTAAGGELLTGLALDGSEACAAPCCDVAERFAPLCTPLWQPASETSSTAAGTTSRREQRMDDFRWVAMVAGTTVPSDPAGRAGEAPDASSDDPMDSRRRGGDACSMSSARGDRGSLPSWLSSAVAAGLGRAERVDPVHPGTGGPAGNAQLTAWTGLVLLVVFAAEGLTLLDVHGLIPWHVAIGAALIPPAALKVASTGWRIIGYYRRSAPYLSAGPPPVLLRIVGPLVILTTVALLATGVVLVLIGQDRSHQTLGDLLGLRVDWIWLHQASFVVWFVAMTIHVLARVVPGVRVAARSLSSPSAVPGLAGRASALVLATALGVGCALVLTGLDHSWTLQEHLGFGHR